MDVRTLNDLCQKLDELAAILAIMEGEPVIVDIFCETSNALRDALAEINRLQADADLHHKTSEALRDALAEIERLRSEAAAFQHTKFDEGLINPPPASMAGATDWFMKFLDRKRALTGEKVEGRKSHQRSIEHRPHRPQA
jgi:hypothetical protein